jgi:hypothetical protein
MQANVSKVGGFLKSSFFSTLIFINFIFTIAFLVSIAAQNSDSNNHPKIEAIDLKPLPQSVSEEESRLALLR